MQEILNFESLGKDGETVWRLSLTPKTDLGATIIIMKGKYEAIGYSMSKQEAHDLAIAILSHQGYSSFS